MPNKLLLFRESETSPASRSPTSPQDSVFCRKSRVAVGNRVYCETFMRALSCVFYLALSLENFFVQFDSLILI